MLNCTPPPPPPHCYIFNPILKLHNLFRSYVNIKLELSEGWFWKVVDLAGEGLLQGCFSSFCIGKYLADRF